MIFLITWRKKYLKEHMIWAWVGTLLEEMLKFSLLLIFQQMRIFLMNFGISA